MAAFTSEVKEEKVPVEIFRSDYKPLDYCAKQVSFCFCLGEENSVVTQTTFYEAVNSESEVNLHLDGDAEPAKMELTSIELMADTFSRPLVCDEDYTLTKNSLSISASALTNLTEFTLKIVTTVRPQENTSLSGLYKSSGNFCTQMEAEGFRNMTYFQDRPDNMSTYTVRIEANKAAYPYLLSNGNDIERGELGDGRHFVVWEDPWLKPCYLFAVVAGDFACLEDSITTCSGRDVALRVFVEHGCLDKAGWAMESLKESFKWDELRFDREYDLGQFNIVAVSDFNMGAMENKSLNLFNSKYVLAREDTATDTDFQLIQKVIGHEYFHNWSGNRVTCRDWFQLTLKEGLTVYRDQEFSSDLNSRAVNRIKSVGVVRGHQFKEAAGPMSHPIRPESYIAMDNFYTTTVYRKGAEVVRMVATILGTAGFKAGLNLYFSRHDGQAVTCEDFIVAMEDGNPGVDLTQFRRWYFTAATPAVSVTTRPLESGAVEVMCRQQTDGTEEPMDIPILMGLVDRSSGQDLLEGGSVCLRLQQEEQVFVLTPSDPLPDGSPTPIVSLLRNFSAPVKLTSNLSSADLAFLSGNDSDPFNRYEAGQEIAKQLLVAAVQAGGLGELPEGEVELLLDVMARTLNDQSLDNEFKALALTLPTADYIGDILPSGTADVFIIAAVLSELKGRVAAALSKPLTAVASKGADAGERALAARALSYLAAGGGEIQQLAVTLARERFTATNNMTVRMGALAALNHLDCTEREASMDDMIKLFGDEPLVVNKWLMLKSSSTLPNTLAVVQELMKDEQRFSITNPNMVYALLGGFSQNVQLFDPSAAAFIADTVVQLDTLNPQVAARMTRAMFISWKKYVPEQGQLLRSQLERIVATQGLSKDVFELASKALV